MTRTRRAILTLFLALVGTVPGRSQASPDEALQRIDSLAKNAVAQGPMAGLSLAVSRGGTDLVARGYGFAHLEHDVPATAETVYRIGSVTKQFTAAAILQLEEAGLLEVDSPLGEFLEDYPEPGKNVTLHQLLNHTSGIKAYTELPGFMGEPARLTYSHERLIATFAGEPLDFPPGTAYRYNNSAYYLLGVVIERVSGQAYGDYLRDEIFEPLEMHSTCYGWNEPIIRHRAAGYDVNSDGQFVNCGYIDMSCPGAAGALCSTAPDLLRWLNGLFQWKVVSDESLQRMTSRQVTTLPAERNYGYGLFLEGADPVQRIYHGGGIHGFAALVAYYPEDELALALLTNTGSGDLDSLERSLTRVCRGLP